MQKIVALILFTTLLHQAVAQDNCSGAVGLCANSLITRTTVGATASAQDPAISCGDNTVNNSVWFSVLGTNTGSCTITVSNINNTPGLEMEVYTGACGSLVSVGVCASGSAATGGNMSLIFPTVAGTTYYIMVDGTGGNQEAFDILASTADDAIVARPDANFNTNPSSGCIPLLAQLQNTTILHGGSNITYDWRFNAGPYIPSSGNDTSITFNTTGTQSITLRVCNTQCGCKTVTQDIIVQNLFPSINYTPVGACVGTDISFSGSAVILPDPPYVDPAITNWQWNFGDPGSGANNTATGQTANHNFTGGPGSYTVTLITDGNCGPATVQTTVILRPRPTVNAGAAQIICEGDAASLTATTTNLVNPIVYSWSGPGTFSCPSCQSTLLNNLLPGGPYTALIHVVDSFSCTADTSVQITVHPKPVVDAGLDQQVCQYSTTALNAVPTAGTGPFSYSWSPASGLNNSNIPNPIATVTAAVNYCVQITDSIGCISDTNCIDISLFPKPSISPSTPILCATQPLLQNVFTVNGAGAGSTYSWTLSPNYSLITGSNADSSSVTVTFPQGIAASYSFTAIVLDGITACRDTVQTVFVITTGLNMSISGPSQLCRGDVISLTASGAASYAWTASPAYAFSDTTLALQSVSPVVSTTFTVTGISGTCSQTIIHSLTVSPKPIANAQPLLPVCGCTMVTLDGSGSTPGMIYHWSSAVANFISDTSALTTTALACVNDVFTLVVIDPMAGCFKDTSITVISNPKPDAMANVFPTPICNGVNTVINLDGSGSNTDPGTTYHWSSNGTAIILDTTSISTTATINTVTTFFLTVTDVLGCDSTVSVSVPIYPLPSLNTSSPFLCTSDTSLLSTLEIIGAASGSIYNWTSVPACVVPNSTSSDSQTFDFTTCGAGNYVFSVTVTDAITSCVNILTQTVRVVTGVNLLVSLDTALCEGGTATLIASGANSYLWSTTDTSNTLSLPGLLASGSPYTFQVTGTIGGCSASDSVKVTVYPVPVTSPITGLLSVCESDTGVIYSVSPSSGNYSWLVGGGQITSGQGTGSITVNWNSAGSGTLSVVDTNSFGCPGPVQNITVNVYALPDSSPSIQGPLQVCELSNQSYYVVPNAGSSYTWVVTGGVINGSSVSDLIQVDWGVSGSGTISVFETNGAACTGPDTVITITIHPKPLPPVVQGIQNICDSTQSVYSTNFVPGSQWSWSVNGGTISNTSSNTDSITVFWNTPGAGSISVTETNAFGCSGDTSLYPVSVTLQPMASAQPDSASLCQNISLPLTGTAIGGLVQWISSGSGTFSDANIPSPVYNPGVSDIGIVRLQMIVSSAPCPNDTATVILYVAPAPVVTITGTSNTICFGQYDTLRVQGGGSYLWTPGASTDSILVVSPPITSTYHVIVSNSVGCSSEDSVTVTVNPPGIPDAGADLLICRGDTASLNGLQGGGGGYQWSSLGDGNFIPNTVDQQVYYIPGSADEASGLVQIVLSTTGYCLNLTDTLLLQVNDLPVIDAGRDTTLISGAGSGVAIPMAPVLQNASGLVWTTSGTGTFSPDNTSLQAIYTPSNEDFTLDSVVITATAIGACIPASDFLVIRISPFEVPNVITPYPSSPGFNDYFEIRNLPPNTELKIWNRWGKMVYYSDDYLNNWEAAGLPEEVYYYVLKTARKEMKGWIQIIRD